jgi:hypothetical protein
MEIVQWQIRIQDDLGISLLISYKGCYSTWFIDVYWGL